MWLLTNGAAAYQLSDCDGDNDMKVSVEGLMIMFIIIMCAAGGNIATQKLMQKGDQPLMLQNAILYVWGVAFNLFNLVVSMRGNPDMGWVGQVEGIQVTSIVFNAVYGLSISIILKRFGAITRTFINTVAIICTALIDYSMWGDSITYLQMTSFATIFCAGTSGLGVGVRVGARVRGWRRSVSVTAEVGRERWGHQPQPAAYVRTPLHTALSSRTIPTHRRIDTPTCARLPHHSQSLATFVSPGSISELDHCKGL